MTEIYRPKNDEYFNSNEKKYIPGDVMLKDAHSFIQYALLVLL
jgi:hypothetical protein